MATKVLVIGASGRVGSLVVKELDKNSDGVAVRLATSRVEQAEEWRAQDREAVVLDLDQPAHYEHALAGVDRVFLLTGYTSDMLFQSKMIVDAAVKMGVSHIVHLGVFTSRRNVIPHFAWHDLVETYIEASNIAWTHLHPNVIADTVLVTDPPLLETGSFHTFGCDAKQGWVFAVDIAAVAAAVLREGPERHAGANYFLSTEVLTGNEVAAILSAQTSRDIKCIPLEPAAMEALFSQIPSVPVRAYMESAVTTAKVTLDGTFEAQNTVHDDVQTVLGRPGITVSQWAREYLSS